MAGNRALYFLEGTAVGGSSTPVVFGMTLYDEMNWETKNVGDIHINKQKEKIPLATMANQWDGVDQKTKLLKVYTPDGTQIQVSWFIASFVGTTPLPEWTACGMATVKTSESVLAVTVYQSDGGEQFQSLDKKISYRRKYIATAVPRPAAYFPKSDKIKPNI